jgi:penicillin G amidase
MKALKIIGLILLLIILGALGYVFYLKSTLTPSYSGELTLTGLNEKVDVYFTEYGVPHIYAKSSEDAYYAFGYVHAQDRLWQMDLLRHVGSGRLSELFGSDLVSTDKYLRTMGLNTYAKESANEFLERNHESTALVKAYIAGINHYIANNPKTLEHTILGLDIEPFTIDNAFEVAVYMAFSFANAQKTDPVLTELASKLDSTYLDDLKIYHYKGETLIPNYDDRYSSISKQTASVLQQLNVPLFIGSNSWVLSGDRTESGKVILANDPHIGFAQPSIWYEAHLVMSETEYYGYHLAGFPFAPILHTDSYANGITMFENDDIDFYVEEIHPEDSNRYQHKGEWKEIKSKKEVIKVKDSEEVTFNIRSTVHGPIVSDILKDDPLVDVVSMYWVTTNHSNYLMETTYGFTHANGIDEIEQSAGKVHGPGLNIMYGDADGNVAWWAIGKLIKRRNERTSKMFYDGSTGLDDATSFYPFDKNPHAINPEIGYVYSANNQPDTVNGVFYSGYYLPDDRGERIIERIESEQKFTVDEVKEMMLDSKSKMAENVKGILLQAIKDTEEGDLLRAMIKWDCDFNKEDFRPLIFQKWIYEILEHAMMDEMGEELWTSYRETHTFKVAIEHLIKNPSSKWWDDITTEENENRTQIIQHAFEETLADLKTYWGEDYTKWKWGDAHTLTHPHAMGSALSFLNIGVFGVDGGNEVINNLGFNYTGDQYQNILFGPSTRRIVDFADVRNNSWSILPTGQSGNYFSPFYDDQAQMYVNGDFRKMMMNQNEIQQSRNKLILSPNN